MSDARYKILRKLDPETLPQDMRGMGFSYKILPTRNNFRGKDLRGCVFYKCHPKLDNEDCIQIGAIAVISERHTALDLKAQILDGMNLQGANLRGAHLKGASLRDADLQGADLKDADLYDANLYGANFQDADLYGAYLYGAHLFDANFNGADLRYANLASANLKGANLEGANLEGAIYDNRTKIVLGDYLIKSKNMRHISEAYA